MTFLDYNNILLENFNKIQVSTLFLSTAVLVIMVSTVTRRHTPCIFPHDVVSTISYAFFGFLGVLKHF